MEYLKVGKYVNTHGLKGEIKIISHVRHKEPLFYEGMTIYIGDKKLPFIVKTYRKHQQYDMIMLESLDSIDKVLDYKGSDIYINRDEISSSLITDVIDYNVYNNNEYIGKVIELLNGVKYDFIVVGDRRIIIPFIDEFIVSINKDKKELKTNYMM